MSEEGSCPHGEPFPGSTSDEHERAFEEILDYIQQYHEDDRPDGGYKAARQFAAHNPDFLDSFLVAFLASEGTRILLEGDEETHVYAVLVAQVISAFEKRMYGNQSAADIEHQNLLVFYKHRIPCDCLDMLVEELVEVEEEEEGDEVNEGPIKIGTCAEPHCGKVRPISELQVCAACEQVYYCNEECQHNHWPIHSRSCIPTEEKGEETPRADLGGSGTCSLSSLISDRSGRSRNSNLSRDSKASNRSNASRKSEGENALLPEPPTKSPRKRVPRSPSPKKSKRHSNRKVDQESPKKKKKKNGKDKKIKKTDSSTGELVSPKKKKKKKVKENDSAPVSPRSASGKPKHDKDIDKINQENLLSVGRKRQDRKAQARRNSSSHVDDSTNDTTTARVFSSALHASAPAIFTDPDAWAFLFDDDITSDDSESPFNDELHQSLQSLLDIGGNKSDSSLGGSHSGSFAEKPLMTILEESVNRSISALFENTLNSPTSPTSPLQTNKPPLQLDVNGHKVSPGKRAPRKVSKPPLPIVEEEELHDSPDAKRKKKKSKRNTSKAPKQSDEKGKSHSKKKKSRKAEKGKMTATQ